MNTGKLIVFEGVSGTGKETQAKLLQTYLAKQQITSSIVFHPTPDLKEVLSLWRKTRSIDATTEFYLLLADRYDRVSQVIQPALDRGEWVISLRNYVSALVYQAKTPEERKWMKEEFFRFEPNPDGLFHFDITPEAALKRIMERHEKTGEAIGKFENPKALEEKRAKFIEVMRDIDHVAIDASLSIEYIHKKIIASIHI
ncbi:MAG: dTMP kinase [Microgenomates group bacterium]